MASSSLPLRRPLAERDLLIDLTAVQPGPSVGLDDLDGLVAWLSREA